MRRSVGVLLSVLLLPVLLVLPGLRLAAWAAQEATPSTTVDDSLPAILQDVDGLTVAVALVASRDDGQVSVGVTAVNLAPGAHGIHVHETGVCDPAGEQAFASAGGHYNPTDEEHGDHAGDLGNIEAEEDGGALFLETTDAFDLDELRDEDGSAIIIHAEEDENDAVGESYGARIACGVLAAPIPVEPAATPVAPVASPVVPVASPAATATVVPVAEPTATAVAEAPDTDADGLSDAAEAENGTDPTNPDSDGDGLLDGAEFETQTDPLAFDSDGDGFGDNQEVVNGTDPNDPASVPAGDPSVDTDGDLLTDVQEADFGTDPEVADTDGDGLSDFAEVGFEPGSATGTDPLDDDTDDDGVTDGAEIEAETDPLDPESL